jgi:ABC-2 type transport system permease protein
MIKNIRIESMIWLQYRPVVLISSALALLLPLGPFLLITHLSQRDPSPGEFIIRAFSEEYLYNSICVTALLPVQLVSFLFIIVICDEYQNGTYKLHLSNGATIYDLWLSKLLSSILVSSLITIFCFLISLVYGWIFSGEFVPVNWEAVYEFLILLIQVFGFISLAIAFALVFRNAGTAVVLFILWFGVAEQFAAYTLAYNLPVKLYPYGFFLPGEALSILSYLDVLEPYNIVLKRQVHVIRSVAIFWVFFVPLLNYYLFKRCYR